VSGRRVRDDHVLLVGLFVTLRNLIDAVPAIIIFMSVINKPTEMGRKSRAHGLSPLVASEFVEVLFGRNAAVAALRLPSCAAATVHRPIRPRRLALFERVYATLCRGGRPQS
jgi:hypothetical protein